MSSADRAPLSRRLAGLAPAEPAEGVSPQLHHALQGWLQQVLVGVAPDRVVRPSADYGSEVRQIMLRLGVDVPPWQLPPELILDAVDATLGMRSWVGSDGGSPWPLADILTAANSVWRVAKQTDGRLGLERRIDATVTAAVSESARAAPAQAAEHLRTAWQAAYGRDPDPDKVFNESIRAVEELACPLIQPNLAAQNRATLGTALGELSGNAAHLWPACCPVMRVGWWLGRRRCTVWAVSARRSWCCTTRGSTPAGIGWCGG
ncbi:hypothetical protein ACPPVO_22955 [Dactylosporangium sp. McL0621]|uniref:hypothetical protein n=1 Tax=Dactylosporangium sp. McL0621 TaxID=3415678 RepID=UPI003CEA6C00